MTTDTLNQRLAISGFRFTPQRQHVYHVLTDKLNHPTAEELFIHAKEEMPEISLATVYNCLDALIRCGLVRQVNLERAPSRYCPNMREHSHFYCDECSKIYDVEPGNASEFCLPEGFLATQVSVSFRGKCPRCSMSAGMPRSAAATEKVMR